jgi:hypothetical protein
VPFAQEALYSAKCVQQGTEGVFHQAFTVEGFGHCSFGVQEILTAFEALLIAAGDGDLGGG